MLRNRSARLGTLTTIALLLSACARPHSSTNVTPEMTGPEIREKYFYANRGYGTEAQFNPVTSILNNGYDQVRTGPDRRVFEFDYDMGGTGAWNSVIRAQGLVRQYGTRDWLRFEVLPLSGKGEGGGQWVPNYQLHLFAGGANYVRLIAWYEQHNVAHPRSAAIATFVAEHMLNEVIENTALTRGSIDAATDLLIFDPAAILLWNSDRVQRFVGSRIEFTEWPGQPTLALPGHTIENTFETTMVRFRVPGVANWRGFTTMGGSYVGGVSRRGRDNTWWSLGVGGDARANPVVDTLTGRKTVDLLGNVGVFYDRSGSLLASFVLKAGFDAGFTVNVYPGLLRVGSARPGIWAQWLRSRELRVGMTSRLGVGIGRNP